MTISIADPFFYGNDDQANEAYVGMQVANQHLELAQEDDDSNHDDILPSSIVGFFQPDDFIIPSSDTEEEDANEYQVMADNFYWRNHKGQTYEFALKMKIEYAKLEKGLMSIWQCCEMLNEIDGEEDPDMHDFQMQHLLRTAEAIRKDYPHQDWLHLTALIHDLGKIMAHSSFGELPHWFVIGDTFPVGCAFDQAVIYHQLFQDNPDSNNPKFNTKLGIYSDGCGLAEVVMSWSHDEYMYLVAKGNKTTLPPVALFIIRFHSFCAMHRDGAYTHLMNEQDHEMLEWLQIFSKYENYDADTKKVNVEEVKPYYLSLIKKYFPGGDVLRW